MAKSKTTPRAPQRKGATRKHFKDAPLLKALGAHCQRLRNQKGYSIDRLAKESEQLSPSVIHRLETGSGAVTVSAVFRYAKTLEIAPKSLFEFDLPADWNSSPPETVRVIAPHHTRVKAEKFKTLLPLYSLKAAAGSFGESQTVEPEGWVEVRAGKSLTPEMFVARAVGNSMLPMIRSGDYLVFRAHPVGSRQGKIVLAQYRGPADPETGGSYTVKRYRSSKIATAVIDSEWEHRQIVLEPLNPEYEPILLNPQDRDDFRIVAEYVFTL